MLWDGVLRMARFLRKKDEKIVEFVRQLVSLGPKDYIGSDPERPDPCVRVYHSSSLPTAAKWYWTVAEGVRIASGHAIDPQAAKVAILASI